MCDSSRAHTSFVVRRSSHTGMLVETNLAALSSENQENDDSSDSFGTKKARIRGPGFKRRERQTSAMQAR